MRDYLRSRRVSTVQLPYSYECRMPVYGYATRSLVTRPVSKYVHEHIFVF